MPESPEGIGFQHFDVEVYACAERHSVFRFHPTKDGVPVI